MEGSRSVRTRKAYAKEECRMFLNFHSFFYKKSGASFVSVLKIGQSSGMYTMTLRKSTTPAQLTQTASSVAENVCVVLVSAMWTIRSASKAHTINNVDIQVNVMQ